MADFKDLAKVMRKQSKKLQTKVDATMFKAAVAVDQTVVLGTPVDTGRARSNWIANIGSPITVGREPFAPGSKLGIGETGNAAAAMNEAIGVFATRKTGQDIYISNNVNYLDELNKGSSAQAGPQFIERAINASVNIFNNVRFLD